ncbi:MAG: hypothetical protein ACI32N_01225 [Bulleidia sp.]
MNRTIRTLITAGMCVSMIGCGQNAGSSTAGSDTLTGTYAVEIGGFDWGCGTTKAIITFDHVVDAVDKDTFTVTETKMATDFSQAPEFPVVEVTNPRTVTDAYLCDENGNRTDSASRYAAVELYVSPNDGSPLLFTMSTQLNTWSDPYYLTIETAEGIVLTSEGTDVTTVTIDTALTGKTTDADMFDTASFTAADGITYNYAAYTPETESDTLVVWLHGLGEGGTENTDPSVTLLANKVTALAGETFQNTLGGAHVLVPQCPTYWMDNDGKGTNFNGGGIQADGTSFYTESLHELIASYKEQIKAEKVVIAGCSNGGYMTMLMGMNYADEYDVLVPICEAVPDAVITDDQISTLKDLPMFFIYSKDDTTVDPTLHEIPTIDRLIQAGAENIHVSTSEHVIDMSGEYKDADGNPYQYMGHWSWIYFDNNDSSCDECGQSVFEWIAEQLN